MTLPLRASTPDQLSRENDLLREALAIAVKELASCVELDYPDPADRALKKLHALGFVTEAGVLHPEHTPIGWGVNPRYGLDFNGVCVACGRNQ